MWELPQVEFYSLTPKMWELPQVEILQSNSENVGTTTSRDFTV